MVFVTDLQLKTTMQTSPVAIVNERPIVDLLELLVLSFAGILAIGHEVGVFALQLRLFVIESHAFEVENFLKIILLLDVLIVTFRLKLCEIIIEHFLLLGVHDRQEEVVADADAVVRLVVLRHQVHLVVRHELVEVPVVILIL